MQKNFTIEEANRAIVLVKPIVEDILSKMASAQVIHEEAKQMQALGRTVETEILGKIRQAESLLNDVEYHMRELEGIGVLLKDLKLGLIDFPCLYNGRIVNLCWKPGEDSIMGWHEISEGFTERKPIARASEVIS